MVTAAEKYSATKAPRLRRVFEFEVVLICTARIVAIKLDRISVEDEAISNEAPEDRLVRYGSEARRGSAFNATRRRDPDVGRGSRIERVLRVDSIRIGDVCAAGLPDRAVAH